MLSEIVDDEAGPEQALRRLADHHLTGTRECLQSRREVGCVTDDRLLLRRILADEITDNDETRGDADACRQPFAGGRRMSRHRLGE